MKTMKKLPSGYGSSIISRIIWQGDLDGSDAQNNLGCNVSFWLRCSPKFSKNAVEWYRMSAITG